MSKLLTDTTEEHKAANERFREVQARQRELEQKITKRAFPHCGPTGHDPVSLGGGGLFKCSRCDLILRPEVESTAVVT